MLRFSDSCHHAAESSPSNDHGNGYIPSQRRYGSVSTNEYVNTCRGVCGSESNGTVEVIVEMKERGNSQSDKEGHNQNVTKSTMHALNPVT